MKRLLITSSLLLASTSLSLAADIPAALPPEPVVAPAFSWTGAYIGAHGGWNWAEIDPDVDDWGFDPDFDDTDGFVIGGQIGYNWQWDTWLIGLEADGSFVDNSDDDNDLDDDVDFGTDQNFLASVRGRVGFAFDRFLVYGTGGAAFTGIDVDDGDESDEASFFGWVAGGGIEYAITDNITFGIEYLHYEFGDEEISDVFVDDFDLGLTNDVVRGRLNFKFNLF